MLVTYDTPTSIQNLILIVFLRDEDIYLPKVCTEGQEKKEIVLFLF